jgi:hypothetical protein
MDGYPGSAPMSNQSVQSGSGGNRGSTYSGNSSWDYRSDRESSLFGLERRLADQPGCEHHRVLHAYFLGPNSEQLLGILWAPFTERLAGLKNPGPFISFQ